jgi:chromosome segregation ATPase
MQNSKIQNEMLRHAVDKMWESTRLSAENILELKTKVKNLEEQNSELYSSFISSDEESNNLKLIKEEFEAKSKEQEEHLENLYDKIKELNLRLDSAAIFEHKYTEIYRLHSELQDKYNSSEQRSKNELLETIKELEASHTNYGFLQKEITRRNFDLHQRDETILKQKESIASLDSKLFILKDLEKKYNSTKEKLESFEQTFDELTSQRDKLMEKLQEAKAQNENVNLASEEKLNKYKVELESQAEAINIYTSKLNNFNIDRSNWNTAKDEYVKLIDTLYDDITLLKEEVSSIKIENDNLKAHNDTISTKDVILDEQNLRIKQLNAVVVANESALEQFNQKIREAEHKCNNVKQEEALLREKFEELKVEANSDKERILSYEKSLTELQIAVNEKDDKIFKSEKEFEELIEHNYSQEIEINELKAKFENSNLSSNEFLQALETENIEMKLLIQANTETITSFEAERYELNRLIEDFREGNSLGEIDLKSTLEKVNELDRQLNILKDTLSQKEDYLKEIQGLSELYQLKNQQLTSSLMDKDKRIDELNSLINKTASPVSNETMFKMQNEIKSFQIQINEKNSLIEDLKEKTKDLELLIKKRYEHIDILEKDLDSEMLANSKEKEERILIANQIQQYMKVIEKYLD